MIDGASPEDRLTLADWRRQIADLYAEVRRGAATDPTSAWEAWRLTRDQLFREHQQSPLPAAARADFQSRYWPYDPDLRFEVRIQRADGVTADTASADLAEPADLPMSTGEHLAFTRIGVAAVPFAAGTRTLSLFWMAGYAGGLFLPFRDATNGEATYGAGRYLLDTAKGADLGRGHARDSLILDFNFAFHPSCAFDPLWSCPISPPENRLDIAIEAGERLR